jgi:alpha-tubulin suppressor-like RCC1 family protein
MLFDNFNDDQMLITDASNNILTDASNATPNPMTRTFQCDNGAKIVTTGTMKMCGDNQYGELGDASNVNTSIFGYVEEPYSSYNNGIPLVGVAKMAFGARHSLALMADGTIESWGDNTYGQLGDGTTISRSLPVNVVDICGNILTDVVDVACGWFHSIALIGDGTLKTWGHGTSGQLGDGGGIDRHYPVTVVDPSGMPLGSIYQSGGIAGGLAHSAAVHVPGKIASWGNNSYGQLGTGTITPSFYAVASDTSGILMKSVACGQYHTIGLVDDISGTLLAWGNGLDGELGNNTNTATMLPVVVLNSNGNGPLINVSKIACGSAHSMALIDNGTMKAWGRRDTGQLGDGKTSPVNTSLPVDVLDTDGSGVLTNVSKITSSKNNHSMFLMNDGSVMGCGYNTSGQLGDNSVITSSLPVVAFGINNAIDIGAGGSMSGIITDEDRLLVRVTNKSIAFAGTWGSNNYGQLGINNIADSSHVMYPTLENVIQIEYGGNFAVALLADGAVWAWGHNNTGQLGNNSYIDSYIPVQVIDSCGNIPLSGIKHIACGDSHTMAMVNDASGTLKSWGYNNLGQLGNGDVVSKITAYNVLDPIGNGLFVDASQVDCGGNTSMILANDGKVYTFGANFYGQLGIGSVDSSAHNLPIYVSGLSSVKQVACGDGHNIVLLNDVSGTAMAWGYNISGQVGDDTSANKSSPVYVYADSFHNYLTDVKKIACGYNHSFALMNNGTTLSWGLNAYGQLGNGITTASPTKLPQLALINNVVDIDGGSSHSIFLINDGTVKCCGLNDDGQLGNMTFTDSNIPLIVVDVSGATHVTAGGFTTGIVVPIETKNNANVIYQLGTPIDCSDTPGLSIVLSNCTSINGQGWGVNDYVVQMIATDSSGTSSNPLIGQINGDDFYWELLDICGNGVNPCQLTNFKFIFDGSGSGSPSAMESLVAFDALQQEIVCVSRDTQILMDDGTYKAIQDIERGEMVAGDLSMTKLYRVSRVNRQRVHSSQRVDLVSFDKDCLGSDKPIQRLVITCNHALIYNGKRRPAKCFENLRGVTRKNERLSVDRMNRMNRMDRMDKSDGESVFLIPEPDGGYILYDLQFETLGSYVANGVVVQSRSPRSRITPLPRSLYFNRSLYRPRMGTGMDDEKYEYPLDFKKLQVYTCNSIKYV